MLDNKPLIMHVLDRIESVVDERIIVISSDEQAREYSEIARKTRSNLVRDWGKLHGPLVGATAGFQKALGDYSLLLPCDTPFVSRNLARLLLELCINMNAVVPRWPDCYIEPLQAAYCTINASRKAGEALAAGRTDMQSMIERLSRIRYLSTLVINEIDPEMQTFFNINTATDLKRAQAILRARHRKNQS